MCGICGIIDFSGRPIDPNAVVKMRDVMIRRGPDAAGPKVLPKIGLGQILPMPASAMGKPPKAKSGTRLGKRLNGKKT